MQDSLFDLSPFTVAAPSPVWERWGGGGIMGQKGAVYLHIPSGWQVRHCMHPTANFPYYILTPDGPVFAANGRGFQRLELAQQHLENLWQDK